MFTHMGSTKNNKAQNTGVPFSRRAGQGTLSLQDLPEVIWLDTGIAVREGRPWTPEPLIHSSHPSASERPVTAFLTNSH